MTLSIRWGVIISALALVALFAFAPRTYAQYLPFGYGQTTQSGSPLCGGFLGNIFRNTPVCTTPSANTSNTAATTNSGSASVSFSPGGGNVHWSTQVGADLCPIDHEGAPTCGGAGIKNPFVQINYNVRVLNQVTGEVIPCGGTASAGTPLKYEFVPHEYTDIDWFASTAAYDSPYGDWLDALGLPDSGKVCKDKNYVGIYDGGGWESGTWKFYSPLVVINPGQSISDIPASFGCTSLSDGSMSCAPSEEGSFTPVFNFAETKGAFYLGFNRGKPPARADGMCDIISSGCLDSQEGNTKVGCAGRPGDRPLSKASPIGNNQWANKGAYYLTVPTQSISCPITITPSTGNPPSTPEVSVTSNGACVYNQPHSITMVATDQDNDMIRYGIDWNNDGSVDEFKPPFGYVPSGTSQTASRVFTDDNTGIHTKTVKVIAQDDDGHSSSWGTVSFSCAAVPAVGAQCSDNADNDGDGKVDSNDPDCSTSGGTSEFTFVPLGSNPPPGIPSADLRLSVPSLIARGKTVQVVWSADNVSSCIAVTGTNGDSFAQLSFGTSFFAPIGGKTSSPINARTTYTLSCIDLIGITRTKTATVNIQPNFREH